MSLLQLMLRKKRLAVVPPPPPPPPPGVYPPLKIPQHKLSAASTGYRSAPASEFRDSIGITSPAGLVGHVSDFTRPAPPGSGASSFANFHHSEMQYLGIRHLRTTPNFLNGQVMQAVRDWGATTVGTKTGKLMMEPGQLINNGSSNNPRCSGVFTNDCCGSIGARLGACIADPAIAQTINVLELMNEPNNFGSYSGVNGPNTAGTDGLTWQQCLGEYHKAVWERYILGDPRCAHMKTVGACPTANYIIDSEIAGDVPDGLDVFTEWGSTEPFCHFGNDHPYCGNLKPGHSFVYNDAVYANPFANLGYSGGGPGMLRGHGAWPSRRYMPTEFGYVLGRIGTTEWWSWLPNWETYANYFLRTYLEAFIRGYERVYWYTLFPQGQGLPRQGRLDDDFSLYTWNGSGTTASVTSWWERTQAVEAMHRMTTTIGDGELQPNITWSVPSPHASLYWVMLRRTTAPGPAHVMALWRGGDSVHFVQQPPRPPGQGDSGLTHAQQVAVAPISARVNLPAATQVTQTNPLDGASNINLTIDGAGSSRGVTVNNLAEKPVLLVIE